MRHDTGLEIILLTLSILAICLLTVFVKNAVIFFTSSDVNLIALKTMVLSLMISLSLVWAIIILLDNRIK